MSQTITATTTFTITDAKKLAAKVAADLKRMQRFYGSPSDSDIAEFEGEVTELLRYGYLGEVTYGYLKDGNHIAPTLRYTAKTLAGDSGQDDDPGRIPMGCNVTGASFYTHLSYSSAWWELSEEQRAAFKSNLPVQRTSASMPGSNGPYVEDRQYASGGRALGRATLRNG